MKWIVKGIVNELVDREKQIYLKKVMLQPSVYTKRFNIPEELKGLISVVYDEKQTQVLYLEVLIPQSVNEIEFLQSLKQYAETFELEEGTEI